SSGPRANRTLFAPIERPFGERRRDGWRPWGPALAPGHDERECQHMKSGFIVDKGPRQVRDTAIPLVRGERRLIVTGLALLGSFALLALPAHADVASSPAKTTAARSADGLDLGGAPSINVQLYKGKPRTMLVVNGGVAATGFVGGGMTIGVKTNGIAMEPTDIADDSRILQTGCQGFCTLTGTWWLDLDLAEKAHPGMFVNVPIDVTLQGVG